MTIDLVDGKAGKAHIDSDDRGSFNIGTMGPGCYVLNVKNKFALTMDSANSGTVDTGGLIMWGRYAHCTEPETITVENGSQNMKRNDLVVMRYTKTTDKIETASLVVIKGTPAASTPSDPQINEVDEITSTTTIADMPLYRIPLDGITVGTPVPLFNVLAPMSELWDSVSRTSVLRGKLSIIKNGIGGGSFRNSPVTFAKPFKRPPDVFVTSDEPVFVVAAQNVSTTGFDYWLHNTESSPNGVDRYPKWVAVGELA
jgi:hypothetical protein